MPRPPKNSFDIIQPSPLQVQRRNAFIEGQVPDSLKLSFIPYQLRKVLETPSIYKQ